MLAGNVEYGNGVARERWVIAEEGKAVMVLVANVEVETGGQHHN